MNEFIEVILGDGKHKYSEVIQGDDLEDIRNSFLECQGNGANPNMEKIKFHEWVKHLESRPLNDEELKKLNGTHFIYGWIEAFYQSSYFSEWMNSKNMKFGVATNIREPYVEKPYISAYKYLAIEIDPSLKPQKRHANNEYRANSGRTYMTIWEGPKKQYSEEIWEEEYELKYNHNGKVLTIQDGKIVPTESIHDWAKSNGYTRRTLDSIKDFCLKRGLKYTIFDSIVAMNQYCLSLGYPRIGNFYNSRPNEDYFEPIAEGEGRRKIYEKWDLKTSTVVERSLDPIKYTTNDLR
jgi:hypothetical protein